MTCTCGHTYEEHDKGGPCCIVEVEGDVSCPCVHFEASDDERPEDS